MGDVYTDPVGDIATGNANLDITQVEVTDNGVDVFISLTVDSLDGDWGKYLLFFDWADGGSGDNDNPWGRDIGGLSGTDYFVGSWLDNGGGTSSSYYELGLGWVDDGAVQSQVIDWGNNTITWSIGSMAAYLVDEGYGGFHFEVATSGGGWGDPAIDLLGGEGTQPGWGQGSTSTDWMYYEVPAPSALVLLAIAGLGRRRRS